MYFKIEDITKTCGALFSGQNILQILKYDISSYICDIDKQFSVFNFSGCPLSKH